MDFKFGKDSGDSQTEEATGEKKKQGSLLVLLLILVGGFAYLYFFTSLIKPLEVQQNTAAPVPAPQSVKMPLPGREAEPTGTPEKTVGKPEPAKATVAAATTKAPPAAIPVTAQTKSAVPAPKQAAPQTKAKEEPKKIEPPKPAGSKPQPVSAAAKPVEKTPQARNDSKKPVAADQKTAPAKENIKKSVAGAQAKIAAKPVKATPDSWSLVLGNYVLEEALSADMGRVRKAGFEPVVAPSIRKKTKMSRLFVTDFADRTTAQTNLEKLKRHTSDAFVIEQGGRFALYAGSYLQSAAANSEKARLTAAGFTIAIKQTDIAIPTQSLTVGPFKEKKAADAALVKLRAAGIKASLAQK